MTEEKIAKFADLDQRRKRILLGNAHALAVAMELITKLCGHKVARSIKNQSMVTFYNMSDLEVDEGIADIEQAIATKKNATGYYQTPKAGINSQN